MLKLSLEFWGIVATFLANLANSNNVTDKRQMAPDLHAFSFALGQLKLIRCQVKSWNLFREPLRDGNDVVFWGTFIYILLGDSFHLLFKARITWQLMPARHPWVKLRAFSSRLWKGNMLGWLLIVSKILLELFWFYIYIKLLQDSGLFWFFPV